jgi:hypothetical protein
MLDLNSHVKLATHQAELGLLYVYAIDHGPLLRQSRAEGNRLDQLAD